MALYLGLLVTCALVTGFKVRTSIGSYRSNDGVPLTASAVCKATEQSRWFGVSGKDPAAVVLLIHGLNQKPSRWDDMISFLTRMNFPVFRLTLAGHGGGPFEDMLSVSAKSWSRDFEKGYRETERRYPGRPKILLAYSAGALVALDYQQSQGKSLFDKQVLFAPAIALNNYVYLLKPLTPFFSHLPSRAPKAYRANDKGTSMAAYRALFDLLGDLHKTGDPLINTDTLVFIHPDDELIDFTGVADLIISGGLTRWTLAPVTAQNNHVSPPYHHLIIDKPSLGAEGWAFVSRSLSAFLRQ